jgi:hypothetical protein
MARVGSEGGQRGGDEQLDENDESSEIQRTGWLMLINDKRAIKSANREAATTWAVCMVVAPCKGGHLETAFELFCDGARAGTVRVGSWTRREGLVEAPLVRRVLAQLSGGDGGSACG